MSRKNDNDTAFIRYRVVTCNGDRYNLLLNDDQVRVFKWFVDNDYLIDYIPVDEEDFETI